MVQHRRVLRQPYRMMEGQLIDHDPKSDGAGITRQGGQVHTGCTEIAHGGSLMLDREIILIPQLLRFLSGANILVVDIRRRGGLCHRCLREDVVETDFQLTHTLAPPCFRSRSVVHHYAIRTYLSTLWFVVNPR